MQFLRKEDTSLRDFDLLKSISAQDSEALSKLYDRYSRLVYSLAWRILRDPHAAETAVQQVFLGIWRRASQYDPARAAVSTWLISITRNQCIDELRKRKRGKEIPWTQTAESIPDEAQSRNPLAGFIQDEKHRLVIQALEEIPDSQKVVIYLAYYDGLSHREIAEKLNEPLGTVKTRIQLGLDKLRGALKAYSQ